MSFQHFRVLMWKNFRLKLYNFKSSLFGIFLPIAITLLIVVLMRLFSGSSTGKSKAIVEEVLMFDPESAINISNSVNVTMCYAPNNPVLSDFMNMLKNGQRNITPFSNEADLEYHILHSGRADLIGVYFKNIESNASIPDKLSYVVRQPLVEVPEIMYNTSEHFKIFMATQISLNENFIKYKTNKTTLQLELQLFPLVVSFGASPLFALILLVITLSILILSIPLIGNIMEEKNSGMKELIKITGTKEWMIWLCWFFDAMYTITISLTIVVCLMTMVPLNDAGKTLANQTPFIVLWIALILYCVDNIAFCFMLSSVFQNSTIATIVFMLYFVMCQFLLDLVETYVPFINWLFPASIYNVGLSEIYYIENKQIDFTWSVFTSTQNEEFRHLPLGLLFIFILLVLNSLLYIFLTYYITNINPGKFGAPKSPFFLFTKLFSKKGDAENLPVTPPEFKMNPKYFETPPSKLQTTIQIVNLHKHFPSVYAVRGVNLKTFKGEITALLGHNGAGKTTTMSILTGLIKPSSGSIYYKNANVFENMDKFRLQIGLCPQENRTFPHLSVIDHLLFFGMLKGMSKKEATEEAEQYLKMTSLEPKRKSKVDELSGGMKRKLCLCIAMMGKAEVLILDEPTSGMDVESRRSLWDLLLKLRQGRTIILSTHYMEEADILGDRIAIMNHGIIVCYGTSIFLKKAYDTGYELTITKGADNLIAKAQVVQSGSEFPTSGQSSNIIAVVQTAIPTASVISDTPKQIVIKLPLTETHKFAEMFRALETGQMRLGIQNIGVSATTMENVFLIAGGATAYDPKSPKIDTRTGRHDALTGSKLFSQQLWAVFKKKFLFTKRDLTAIFMRVILPTFILYVLIRESKMMPGEEKRVSLSSCYPGTKIIYQEVNPYVSLEKQIEEYVAENKGSVMKGNGTDIVQTIISIAREFPDTYQTDYSSALSVNSTSAKLLYSYNTYSRLAALDMYYNVLLRSLAKSKNYSIETFSHPIPQSKPNSTLAIPSGCPKVESSGDRTLAWFLVLAFFTSDLLSYFSTFVSIERVDGFYHIQMMSRLSPFVYWLGTFLFDFLLFYIFMILRLAIFKIYNDALFLGFHQAFFFFMLILALYGISGLLMIYIFSFSVNTKDGSFTFYLFFHAIIVVLVIVYTYLNALSTLGGVWPIVFRIIWVFSLILPPLTYYLAFVKLFNAFGTNSSCMQCIESYKALCEAALSIGKKSYWEELHRYIITFLVQIVVYSILLSLLSSGTFGRFINNLKIFFFGSKSDKIDRGDDDVLRESDRVEKLKNAMPGTQKVSLLVDGLRKNYVKWGRNFTAVSHTSFVAERSTCFGLLGVNGAGKSTTFKMLTAEILPTSGDASIEGVKLSEDTKKYLSAAGYCAQTNCFIEQLTGVEMLSLIASMRGVSAEDKKELVNKWITIIGLNEYKDRRCGTYSGGNKRKLCSVMSLIGDPKVVFLDEPTSGVDPVSRRNLYDVMAQTRRAGQTVILTSHSMEECEILCDRITIMVNGVMKCIGSAQHLKKRYAQGFSLLIKIKDSPTARTKLTEFKQHMESQFPPSRIILKDEHPGVLYYQITETSLLWSVLFQKMEEIKLRYTDVVDDYVLTDTTLEEVFISFAKVNDDDDDE